MISAQMIEFLQKPLAMNAASRDEELQAYIVRALGMVRVMDGETIGFYTPRSGAEKMLNNCANNKRVALVVCDIPTFETYQFKGEFIAARECTAEEQASVDTYLARFREIAIQIGYPEDILSNWRFFDSKPCIDVRFKVEEIFFQTPGPNTGNAVAG